MANRYWVGGSGSWDFYTTTNWSTTSGGTGGASAPTSTDDVFFDQAGTYTVTLTGGAVARNFTVSAGTVSFTGAATLELYGNIDLISTTTFNISGASAAVYLYGQSNTESTIKTNGVSINCGIFYWGYSNLSQSWKLLDNLTINTTTDHRVYYGTINLNGFVFTCRDFYPFYTFGVNFSTAGSRIDVYGNNITILNLSASALTITGTPYFKSTYTGSTGTRTITTSSYTQSNALDVSLSGSSGIVLGTTATDAIRLSGTGFGAVDLTGGSNDIDFYAGVTIYNNFTLSSSLGAITGTSGGITFSSATGTRTITTNGKALGCSVTFSSGTWQLQDAMTVQNSTTLNGATLALNGKTLTTNSFTSISGTRTLSFGTGNITVTGSGQSWYTSTGLTVTGSAIVNVSNPTSTATTITPGTLSEANSLNFNFTTGTYSLTMSNGNAFKDLDFTGFSGTVTAGFKTIYGNVNLGTTATFSGGVGTWTFASTSGTKTITTNGKTMDFPLTFNGGSSAPSWQLQDALTVGSTRTITLTNGTLNINGKTATTGNFALGSGTKNITYNGGSFVVTGASWNTSTNQTGFTTSGTGTISMTRASAKTMNPSTATPMNATVNQGGAGALTIGPTGASGLLNDITATSLPSTIILRAANTTRVSNFTASGVLGSLLTLISSTAGTQATLSKTTGIVSCDYLAIKDSAATGGASWYAGPNSTNNGNNTGWIFSAPPTFSPGGFFAFF